MRLWRRSFNPSGPEYGGKKTNMPSRPLVPLLFAFTAGLLASFFTLPVDSAFGIVPAALFVVLLILCLVVPAGAKYSLCLFLFFFAGSLLELSNRHSSELVALAERQERVTIEGTVLEPAGLPRRDHDRCCEGRSTPGLGERKGSRRKNPGHDLQTGHGPCSGGQDSLSGKAQGVPQFQQPGPVRLCAGHGNQRPLVRCFSDGWKTDRSLGKRGPRFSF